MNRRIPRSEADTAHRAIPYIVGAALLGLTGILFGLIVVAQIVVP